jgi:hypothetical protein
MSFGFGIPPIMQPVAQQHSTTTPTQQQPHDQHGVFPSAFENFKKPFDAAGTAHDVGSLFGAHTPSSLAKPFAGLGGALGGTSILQGGLEALHGDPISGAMHAGSGALGIASAHQELSKPAPTRPVESPKASNMKPGEAHAADARATAEADAADARAAETAGTAGRTAAAAGDSRAAITALEAGEEWGGIPGLAALAATAAADGESQVHGVRGGIGSIGDVQHGVSSALGGGFFGNAAGGLAAFGAAQPLLGFGLAKDVGVGGFNALKSTAEMGVQTFNDNKTAGLGGATHALLGNGTASDIASSVVGTATAPMAPAGRFVDSTVHSVLGNNVASDAIGGAAKAVTDPVGTVSGIADSIFG